MNTPYPSLPKLLLPRRFRHPHRHPFRPHPHLHRHHLLPPHNPPPEQFPKLRNPASSHACSRRNHPLRPPQLQHQQPPRHLSPPKAAPTTISQNFLALLLLPPAHRHPLRHLRQLQPPVKNPASSLACFRRCPPLRQLPLPPGLQYRATPSPPHRHPRTPVPRPSAHRRRKTNPASSLACSKAH